jgi:hypothetical protein
MSARLRRVALAVAFLVVVTAGTAAAANPGDPWLLGVTNTIDSATELTGTVAERIVKITNEGTGRALSLLATTAANSGTLLVTNTGDGVGVQIVVKEGARPISVNATAGKATNLNVDKLDGLDSTELQKRVSGACAVGATIQAINADGTVVCSSKSADAELLDGRDSTSFMGSNNYERRKTTDGSANVGGTCPDGDLCFAGGYYCDTGDTMLGGGYDQIDNGTRVVASEPFTPNPQDTWRIKFINNGTEDTIEVITLCADNPPFRP